MSESAKRPAYEVIIQKIRKDLEGLHGIGGSEEYFDGLRSLRATSVLLGILREIDVPEKERAEILADFQRVLRTWNWREDESPSYDTIEDIDNLCAEMYDILSRQ